MCIRDSDDSEQRDRCGVSTESGARAPGEVLSLNGLERIYRDDGRQYATSDYEPVLNALRKFGDLPSVAEVYSPPRVAAQAMTVGLRPGFRIDSGTLKPDGTPWNLESDHDYKLFQAWRREEKPVL